MQSLLRLLSLFSFSIVERAALVVRERKNKERSDVIVFFFLRRSLFSFSPYHLLMESYVKNGKKKNGGKKTQHSKAFSFFFKTDVSQCEGNK
jgi:hypothetical protein